MKMNRKDLKVKHPQGGHVNCPAKKEQTKKQLQEYIDKKMVEYRKNYLN